MLVQSEELLTARISGWLPRDMEFTIRYVLGNDNSEPIYYVLLRLAEPGGTLTVN